MNEALYPLHVSFDAGLGGVLLANMLEGWLDGDPEVLPTAEVANEPQDCRTSPEQTRLHLFTPVHAGSGTSPSGEHGAPVCTAGESTATGLERIADPHTRSGPGQDWDRNGRAGGLQDPGSGCLHGSSGCGVCTGSLAVGTIEPRLAPATGVVCAHHNSGDRRGWLLRPRGLQRRIVARVEGHNGPSRVTFLARAPPGRQAQQSEEGRVAF